MGSQMVPLWQEDGWVSRLGSFCGVMLDTTTKRNNIIQLWFPDGCNPDFDGWEYMVFKKSIDGWVS